MNESEKQFSFTRAASSTSGRAKKQILLSSMPLLLLVAGAHAADTIAYSDYNQGEDFQTSWSVGSAGYTPVWVPDGSGGVITEVWITWSAYQFTSEATGPLSRVTLSLLGAPTDLTPFGPINPDSDYSAKVQLYSDSGGQMGGLLKSWDAIGLHTDVIKNYLFTSNDEALILYKGRSYWIKLVPYSTNSAAAWYGAYAGQPLTGQAHYTGLPASDTPSYDGQTDAPGTMLITVSDTGSTNPMVQFTANPTNGLYPLTVQFGSGNLDSSGHAIIAWNWSFGDGALSTAPNPSHTYLTTGAFSPMLLATNDVGVPVPGNGPSVTVLYNYNPGIVSNGGFETGTFAGWNFPNGQAFETVIAVPRWCHSGTYAAHLGSLGLSYMAQTLATTPDASYTLSYWLNVESSGPNQFLVRWNGITLTNQTNLTLAGWTQYQFPATATSSSTVLQFGYDQGMSYFDLDDISLMPVPASAPTMTIVSPAANQIMISWPTTAGLQLMSASNLATPIAWQLITNGIVDNGGVSSITVSNAFDRLSHFYRLATP
jgi:hypothetical protein